MYCQLAGLRIESSYAGFLDQVRDTDNSCFSNITKNVLEENPEPRTIDNCQEFRNVHTLNSSWNKSRNGISIGRQSNS
jgi:hypothetical protein